MLRHALAEVDHDDPLAEELEVELVSAAYISLAARPLLAAEIARIAGARRRPRTALDRLHLMASAFETAIAAGPAERSPPSSPAARSPAQSVPTDVSAGGHVFITAATALLFSERFDEAERAYDRAVADARRRGSSVGFAAASSLRSLLHYRRGRLSEAEADATAALDLRNEVQGSQGYLACALNSLVFARLERGEADHELLALVDDFFATQPTEDLPYSQAIHARGWLRARARRPRGRAGGAAGVRRARAAVGRRDAADRRLALGGRRGLPDARPDRPGARADRRGAHAGAPIGAPRAIGVALRAAALAERASGGSRCSRRRSRR